VIALDRGNSKERAAVAPIAYPAVGVLERTVVVLVEIDICRSRRSARGLDPTREIGQVRGLVDVLERR
jgi:hypothetical protein